MTRGFGKSSDSGNRIKHGGFGTLDGGDGIFRGNFGDEIYDFYKSVSFFMAQLNNYNRPYYNFHPFK